jgi:hypothetical protein
MLIIPQLRASPAHPSLKLTAMSILVGSNTPMTFLPSDVGIQLMISRYVLIGTSTVCYRFTICQPGTNTPNLS